MTRIHAMRYSGADKFAIGAAGLAMMVGLLQGCVSQPASTTRVIGTLALTAADVAGPPPGDIDIPDAKLALETADGKVVAVGTTILNGDFALTAPTPGAYKVCWAVGGNVGCGATLTAGPTTSAGVIRFRSAKPVIIGSALTADGRACWMSDSFFGLDVSTKVSAMGANGNAVGAPVRANVQGVYALFGIAPGRYSVTAQCEAATISGQVALGGAMARADLVLPDHAPILSVYASDGSKGVTQVAPGAAVKLIASAVDRDGRAVEYLWRTNGDAGVLAAGTGPTRQWTLSATPGQQSVYVMARDGAGGYAFKRFDLRAGDAKVTFSGQVLDEVTGAPVSAAAVTVGAMATQTSATGWFQVTTDPLPGDRYVLNIRHPNYALASRVYDRSAVSDTYQLIPAQVSTVSSGGVINIVDTRSGGPCGPGDTGAPTSGPNHAGVRKVAPTQVVVDPTDPRTPDQVKADSARLLAVARTQDAAKCDPRGAQVSIPAGGLVGPSSQPPSGMIRVAVTTLNAARRALPGDDGATTSGGQDTGLLSFGAVYVDLRDGAGNRLQLKPGAAAAIRIPVSAADQPHAGPTIPFWSYNEQTGRWAQEGLATLQNAPSGWMYVGATSHFSVLNMDYNITDVAHATCLAVSISPAIRVGWTNLVLRNYMTFNGTEQQVKEVALDSADIHGIWRIPYGNPIPTTVRLELRGTFGGQQSIILDNIINTDARPHMTGTNLLPPYPYTACGAVEELTTAPGIIPNYGIADASGRPAFLSGPTGVFNPANGDALAAAYYAATGAEANLGLWWTDHGFAADGSGVDPSFTQADYLNFNDLGFGRDMHCTKFGVGLHNLACYVTNYGLPDQALGNADDALAHNALKRGATVVMTYDAADPTAAERVQFAVYGGGVAASGRINFADLDGFGPKPVPFLCMVCHGGQSALGASNKSQFARFREFDLQSFRYPMARQWDYSGPNNNSLTAAELTSFARLNQLVQTSTSGKPIGNLIGAWYPGGFTGAPKPVQPAPPSGWSSNAAGYQEVYGKTCRSCHVARDEDSSSAQLVFNSVTDFTYFGLTKARVCGADSPKQRVMPNAIVTYKNFWADTSRVSQFEILAGQAAGTCGSP